MIDKKYYHFIKSKQSIKGKISKLFMYQYKSVILNYVFPSLINISIIFEYILVLLYFHDL